MAANGNKVVKTNIVNDRGIHICKSMLAWKKYGNGETPETSGTKGDNLVGDYYVSFDKHYKAEVCLLYTSRWIDSRIFIQVRKFPGCRAVGYKSISQQYNRSHVFQSDFSLGTLFPEVTGSICLVP